MANILGIDYYRVVSETGEGEWSQVYVKTAFDEEEVDKFGSVFGVLKLAGKGDLVSKGMGLISEIEKWCGDPNHKGDVAGLLALLKKKLASGAFLWIYQEGSGVRRVKAGALSGNGVALLRGGQRVWLFEEGDGRVVKGELLDGDMVFFGSREAVNLIDKENLNKGDLENISEKIMAEMMKMEDGARAALILTTKSIAPPSSEGDLEDKWKEKKVEKRTEELVSDRVVGLSGMAGRLASVKMSWKDFVSKRQEIGRLQSDEIVQKKHRLFLFVGMVFLVILSISVSLGLIKAGRDRKLAQFNAVYEPLEKKRAEAESLFELNPVGARELLRSVKAEVAEKKGQFDKTMFEGKMTDLSKAVEESWIKVSGEQKTSLDLFFNLGLVRSAMKGDRIGFDGTRLLVLDSTAGVVAKIGYPDKKQEVVLGKGEGQDWLDVAGLKEDQVLLTKTELVGLLSGKRSEMSFDAAVLEPIAVEVFTGAAYVLDKGSSEIWRFGLSGGQVNDRRRWLAPGVEIDIAGAVDLAIDTDVWVGLSNGKIIRLRRGQVEKFGLTDVPDGLGIKRLAVFNDSNIIAVLDSVKGRIVLFNKETGAYMKQILASELSGATDLVWVSDHELVILSGDKLYLTTI